MNKTVLIMAAGMGSRYGGLKQLDHIGPGGETIIDYAVFDAVRAGFNKIVFIIRKDIEEEFRRVIGSRLSDKVAVEYVFQELNDLPEGFNVPQERSKPWGTGHAMLCAEKVVKEPFIVINADDFYGFDAFKKAADFLDRITSSKLEAALVGYYLKNTLSNHGSVARGVCSADKEGNLIDVEEILEIHRNPQGKIQASNREGLDDNNLVSMNLWAFSPEVFQFSQQYFINFLEKHRDETKSEFYIPLIVNTLIQEEKLPVKVLETDAAWFGVTYKEDKADVIAKIKALIEGGQYPEKL
ncbi:MAG: nucleotidyltransferase [Spirochaetaceae bacterium 4572_59]|nr:MAG: nucleotidyltransferase [Spirochaetaceae bacterium 4572_59]